MAGDLNRPLEVTKAKNRWEVDTDISGVGISLGARSIRGNVTEAILYTDVIARLSLDNLRRRFGSSPVVHESNTSSVRFTAMPANITTSADVLESKVNSQSVVQRVTIRRS